MTSPIGILLEHATSPGTADLDARWLRDALGDPDDGSAVAALLCETPGLRDHFADAVVDRVASGDGADARWIAVASRIEDTTVDESIDDLLADETDRQAAIDGLIRAGTDWYHPDLVDALDDESTGFGATWLLARTAPDELREAIADVESTALLCDMLRIAGLAGDPDWFESLREWRDHLFESDEELSDRQKSRLDGALATVDPGEYARLLLAGEVRDEWLGDDRIVADFLTRHGLTDWVAPLAIFRHVRDVQAFELTAAFATSAAVTDPFVDCDEDELDPTKAEDWVDESPATISFQLALAGQSQELADLLVETALHAAVERREIAPPPITGLPLSGSPPSPDEIDDRIEPLRGLAFDDARQRVQLIRTLTDLHRLVRRGDCPADIATPVFDEFTDRFDAVERLRDTVRQQRPLCNIDDWGCRGLHAATWPLDQPDREGLRDVAGALFDCPPERAPVYRATVGVLVDALGSDF